MKKKTKLDELDCRLTKILQKDGRKSNTALAKELGVTESTVRSRLKRLLSDGVFRIVAVGNPIKLGFEIVGNLKIKINIKKKDEVLAELKKIDALHYIALTAGSMDVDVDFIVKSLDELHQLLFEKVNKIEGIISTETSLITEIVKDSDDWGTAWY